jgi:TolB protein
MARRLMLTAIASAALLLASGATRPGDLAASSTVCEPAKQGCFQLDSTIALTSTRDAPTATGAERFNAGEIYLMNPDADNPDPRRLTNNTSADSFPNLSPDGKKIAFDSNRNRTETDPLNTSDLFVMDTHGSGQTFLTGGSSATWSPGGKNIAFHASASGTGLPIKADPGAATSDSDIFTANLDDLIAGIEQPTNITNTPEQIEDDADWSPEMPGGSKIVFTSHPTTDNPQNSVLAEIYVMNADGSGRTQLTFNTYEERAAAWSPDGTRIVFSCRIGGTDFEICVMNADGSGLVQLTDNTVGDLTVTWAPDGTKFVFHKTPQNELWVMNQDGTGEAQLTDTPGLNLLANWGAVRVHQHL